MKKIEISIITVILIVIGVVVWYRNNYVLSSRLGDVSKYKTKEVTSELFTKREIDDAISVITDYFKENFKGCTLKEIYYAGDEYIKKYVEFEDDKIVLLSTFYVSRNGGDGSLNQNYTYEDWNWILIKNENGEWEHIDHGY